MVSVFEGEDEEEGMVWWWCGGVVVVGGAIDQELIGRVRISHGFGLLLRALKQHLCLYHHHHSSHHHSSPLISFTHLAAPERTLSTCSG
jgi:hypothetical protein